MLASPEVSAFLENKKTRHVWHPNNTASLSRCFQHFRSVNTWYKWINQFKKITDPHCNWPTVSISEKKQNMKLWGRLWHVSFVSLSFSHSLQESWLMCWNNNWDQFGVGCLAQGHVHKRSRRASGSTCKYRQLMTYLISLAAASRFNCFKSS